MLVVEDLDPRLMSSGTQADVPQRAAHVDQSGRLAGLPKTQSFNLGVTACGVAGNIASWFVVNSLGRRTVLPTGVFSLLALLLLIGIMDVIPVNGAQWVQAAAKVIYNFVYFATIGSMAYTILGETSSAALWAKTSGLAAATQ
ncbi:hypothetical protein BJX70DRAFT_404703 [Aspergillus crustosus]